jgi:acetolactate synthase-1/2/3 large subunit
MDGGLPRREFLKTGAIPSALGIGGRPANLSLQGKMSGARALARTLLAENCGCVFGIPGAQENELWDEFKQQGVPYLLAAHEFSAACMADGWARSTGRPGVLCVVPGPGLTNSLSGLGEALLDSIPIVALVGDVGNGKHERPFQVHGLPTVDLLRPVCKDVLAAPCCKDIPRLVQQAFWCCQSGEPGPVAVVVPYNLLSETAEFPSLAHAPPEAAFDAAAVQRAMSMLADRRWRVGIYAGLGCMDAAPLLRQFAEMLQAPVATSISGKGVFDETHPLSVGWGYGPQGTVAAEQIFKHDVDLVLALGVKFSEVSTGFYSFPQPRMMIHVDANPANLGRIYRAHVCVAADAGVFLQQGLECQDTLARPKDERLQRRIGQLHAAERQSRRKCFAQTAVDPMNLIECLRRHLCDDALFYVDVTVSEHWAAEAFTTRHPRTFFNPTDNQSMGWSIPAAMGGQRAFPCRQVATLTGDGCFLMSAIEISTAAREGLPVKFFILDDGAYHYMQALQKAAYLRTTATILSQLDYASLARGLGIEYFEIRCAGELDATVRAAVHFAGPALVRVAVDYTKRPIRWLDAVRGRYIDELSPRQKMRFLSRLGTRALDLKPEVND